MWQVFNFFISKGDLIKHELQFSKMKCCLPCKNVACQNLDKMSKETAKYGYLLDWHNNTDRTWPPWKCILEYYLRPTIPTMYQKKTKELRTEGTWIPYTSLQGNKNLSLYLIIFFMHNRLKTIKKGCIAEVAASFIDMMLACTVKLRSIEPR